MTELAVYALYHEVTLVALTLTQDKDTGLRPPLPFADPRHNHAS